MEKTFLVIKSNFRAVYFQQTDRFRVFFIFEAFFVDSLTSNSTRTSFHRYDSSRSNEGHCYICKWIVRDILCSNINQETIVVQNNMSNQMFLLTMAVLDTKRDLKYFMAFDFLYTNLPVRDTCHKIPSPTPFVLQLALIKEL